MRIVANELLAIACLAIAGAASAQATLNPADAAGHVGQQATICGLVASAKYSPRSKGAPTFLNLDKPYPDQIFTVLIWGSARTKFTSPPESLQGTNICVTGQISSFRGAPEIVVNQPSQISRGH